MGLMSWHKNENEPEAPETLFTSDAPSGDHEEILYDLWTVVARMVERRESENAAGLQRILARTNATNGYVNLQWVTEEVQAAGSWLYTVYLPQLQAASLEHPRGAFYFDEQLRVAIFCLSEDLWDNDQFDDGLRRREKASGHRVLRARAAKIPREDFQLYLATELGGEPEHVLV